MRSLKLDNIKALLIFLIVFGHILELCKGEVAHGVYIFLYSFHVPAFVFCSGFLAKYDLKKILSTVLFPYVVFQILYIVFLKQKTTLLTPYWLMWYMFALFFWRLSLALYENNRQLVVALPVSIVMAVLVGFEIEVGYFFSLSRIICLYPFFLLGTIFKRYNLLYKPVKSKINKLIILLAFIVNSIILLTFSDTIHKTAMYYTYSYENIGDMFFRIYILATAFLGIAVLVLFVREKNMIFTYMGKNTLAIYLLHGFVVKLFISELGVPNVLVALIMAAFIVLFLSLKPISNFLNRFFAFNVKKGLH